MRYTLLFLLCMLSTSVILAQKAKFKTKRCPVQKIKLPTKYVEPENRTFAIQTKGIFAHNVGDPTQGIYGWTYDEDSPSIEALVSIYGFSINPPVKSSAKKTKKDKDGKVTDTWTEYTYSGSGVGKATLYTYGVSEPFVYYKPNSKAQKKAEAKKAAKEKEVADNPFMSPAEASSDGEGEENTGEDSGLDGTEMPLAEQVSLDIQKSVKTRAHRSSSNAYKAYRENQLTTLYNFRAGYPTQVYRNAVKRLNDQYGYSPTNYLAWLREMKSEKHPEYKMWNDACNASAAFFKDFRYNQSISDYQQRFDPIIAYFNGQVESISDSDKKQSKLKKEAFNNLVEIMFYLDRYEQVIALCEAQRDSKVLDKPASKMLERANRQVALMAFHKVDTRHFEDLADVNEEDIAVEESEEESDDGKR